MSGDHGKFCWYELMTTSMDGAKGFYGEALGWSAQDWPESAQPYAMWKTGEDMVGGLMALPEEVAQMNVPPHWLAYVAVDDVDAAAAKAAALGGAVQVPPTPIPGVGRFAVIADPQGAVFAIYRSSQDSDTVDNGDSPGQITWHELMSTDHEAAWPFYEAMFGWRRVQDMDMGPMGTYRLFSAGLERSNGGMFNQPAAGAPPCWLLYVTVADIEATIERVKQAGGALLNGPSEVPGGDRVAQCTDPQGAAFALHQLASA